MQQRCDCSLAEHLRQSTLPLNSNAARATQAFVLKRFRNPDLTSFTRVRDSAMSDPCVEFLLAIIGPPSRVSLVFNRYDTAGCPCRAVTVVTLLRLSGACGASLVGDWVTH